MTPKQWSKDWTRRVGNEHYCGATCQERFVVDVVAEAVAEEREACAKVAEEHGGIKNIKPKTIAAAIISRGKG